MQNNNQLLETLAKQLGTTVEYLWGVLLKAAEVIRQHKSEVVTESILMPGSMVKAVKENWKTDTYHKGRLVGFTRDGSPVVEDRTGGIGVYDGVEPYDEEEENLKIVKDLMADLGITKEDL